MAYEGIKIEVYPYMQNNYSKILVCQENLLSWNEPGTHLSQCGHNLLSHFPAQNQMASPVLFQGLQHKNVVCQDEHRFLRVVRYGH